MCKVDGCEKNIDRKGFCSVHYMRQWRNGFTELKQKRKDVLVHSQGYLLVYKKGHPLTDKSNYVYEHRLVYYEANGAGPFSCYWCGKAITWKCLHIDHLDDSKANNSIENLEATCPKCNQKRGDKKRIETWRKKTGIKYKNKIYSMQELADIKGISRHSLILRLEKMDINEAMEKPRGKTGPRSRNMGKSNYDCIDWR